MRSWSGAEAGERRGSHGLHLQLWRATGDRAHLQDAKRLLDDALANVPEEYHDAMCENVRVNREILAAWRTEFAHEPDAPSAGPPGEAPTRAE